MEWHPRIETGDGSLHRRIVAALESDIASGALLPETRLPTHRRLAELLGVGLGTVTKAYSEAEAKGLLTARVGRGSFVASSHAQRDKAREEGIDLGRNLPPTPHAEASLADTLLRLRRRADLQSHLDYPPPAGVEAHRKAAAHWLEATANWQHLDWQRLICCAGAQQAIAISLAAACRPGDSLIVEAATFTGVKALAAHMDYRLVGAAMDSEGVMPDALDRAAAQSGARVAYLQPLQNPTARIMSAKRREAIVAVARKRNLWLVEDDLYAAYASDLELPPLAALAPERVFYVNGLSKSLTPGLRIGYCIPPQNGDGTEHCLAALRAIAFGPPVWGGLLAAQWIEDGTARKILDSHRAAFAARTQSALNILGAAAERPKNRTATHLWLPMSEIDAERAASRALREGVQVMSPNAPLVSGSKDHGIRVCLGAPPTLQILEDGVRVLARALGDRAERTWDTV